MQNQTKFSVVFTAIFFSALVNGAESITNYLDGYVYQSHDELSEKNMIVSKVRDDHVSDEYQLFIIQKMKSGHSFSISAKVGEDIKTIDRNDISTALSLAVSSGKNASMSVAYHVTKDEVIALYGENSFLNAEMIRCEINDFTMMATMKEGIYEISISEKDKGSFTKESLNLLTFC
ncbi:hypothetical protein [Photobacterium galatheae]|uniref:Uncharacterized protein n=1 Tax=Photobacterium galatheae TaxID=1654360 RepID=A0A066RU15_9GAMM|nr:hypothetical protein [Photobacterium galatheae]KDM90878.1 hypothetical protein EA58_14050 [Photobacterium galatheae]MCM0149154.1 hypothetical protein [Photobacterium galatheae]